MSSSKANKNDKTNPKTLKAKILPPLYTLIGIFKAFVPSFFIEINYIYILKIKIPWLEPIFFVNVNVCDTSNIDINVIQTH
jgi:hypothetical protein